MKTTRRMLFLMVIAALLGNWHVPQAYALDIVQNGGPVAAIVVAGIAKPYPFYAEKYNKVANYRIPRGYHR